jgi:hypothetical protein
MGSRDLGFDNKSADRQMNLPAFGFQMIPTQGAPWTRQGAVVPHEIKPYATGSNQRL